MPALLLLLLSSVGCLGALPPSTSPSPVTDAPSAQSSSATYELRVGASVAPSGAGITVTFVGVREDSRCPTGVSCIWEGDALVELRVQAASGSPTTLELHTSDRFAREGTAHGATIRLERLMPQPTAEGPVPAGAYVVTISVVP